MTHYDHTDNLVQGTCISCGVVFAMTETLIRHFKATNRNFTCPHGHAQQYKESEADQLRAELEDVKGRRDYYQKAFWDNEKRLRYMRGQVTRWKRIAKKAGGK